MTKDRIRQAAIKRFAEQGYDATSMAEIAGDADIKAPAIYAHFKGKEALFKEVLHNCIARELEHTRLFLSTEGKAEETLRAFLQNFGERFEKEPHVRFLLHVYYLPPAKIEARLLPILEQYNENREQLINEIFKRLPPCRVPPERLAQAYLGIMDSVQAEALYGGREKFQKRLAALWELFHLAFEG